jgi:hypothetical protein
MLPSGTTVVITITLLPPSNQQLNQKAADRIPGQPLSFDRAKSLVALDRGRSSRARVKDGVRNESGTAEITRKR